MNSPRSHESGSDEARRAFDIHRRAARAMIQRIVLRGDDGQLDSGYHQGTTDEELRRQVFRTQQEALRHDPTGEFDRPVSFTLAETIAYSPLTELAELNRPLTPERLLQIDPELLPTIERVEAVGIDWPTADAMFDDVLPPDFDDLRFGQRLVERGQAYNNFPAMLGALPSVPREGEDAISFMHRTQLFQYASKPYLVRAHMVLPVFMGALQRRIEEIGSVQGWRQSLYRAMTEAEPDPEDQILLRASRLSYQLLINLMRSDDLQIQSRLLRMSTQQPITDATTELWT